MDTRRINLVAIFLWLAAIAGSALLDAHVAWFMRTHGVESFLLSHRLLKEVLKFPGEYYFTVIVAIVVALLSVAGWRAGLFVLLASAVSGVNGLVKWIVGRTRPFKLHDNLAEPFTFQCFRGGFRGFFDQKNLCFPSGHAALAFATAAALGILWPRFRWAFYIGAGVVALERIAENAHWFSDTVAAAALGIAGVHLIARFWQPRLDRALHD